MHKAAACLSNEKQRINQSFPTSIPGDEMALHFNMINKEIFILLQRLFS